MTNGQDTSAAWMFMLRLSRKCPIDYWVPRDCVESLGLELREVVITLHIGGGGTELRSSGRPATSAIKHWIIFQPSISHSRLCSLLDLVKPWIHLLNNFLPSSPFHLGLLKERTFLLFWDASVPQKSRAICGWMNELMNEWLYKGTDFERIIILVDNKIGLY